MSNSNVPSYPTIPPSVSKQLVSMVAKERNSNITKQQGGTSTTSKRVPPEAAEAISEALRLFVREAHRRASIEAECDDEAGFQTNGESNGDGDGKRQRSTSKALLLSPDDSNENNGNNGTPINAHHVTRIAGDLLMDFS